MAKPEAPAADAGRGGTGRPTVRIVFDSPFQLRYESIEIAPPGKGEVLVRARWTAISPGTECGRFSGTLPPRKYPCTVGYSMVGEVEKVGEGVAGYREGDLVFCQAPHQSRVLVPADGVLFPIGREIERIATMATLLRIALYIVRKSQVSLGESILVVGAGTVGLLITQLLKFHMPIVAGRNQDRLDLARKFGASTTIETNGRRLSESVASLTEGQGARTVFECTGDPGVLVEALACCAQGGKLVLGGSYGQPVPALDVQGLLNFRDVSIVPAHQPNDSPDSQRRMTQFALRLLEAGRINVEDLLNGVHPFHEAEEVYRSLLSRTHRPVCLLDWSGA